MFVNSILIIMNTNFISAKVQIVQYPEVVREVPGTRKDMQCTATGDPPPIITWLKDGTPVNDSNFHLYMYSEQFTYKHLTNHHIQ